MDIELGYFLSYLEDEFRDFSDVRVRVSPKTGTRRSPDLVQDYDPETQRLHTQRGVYVSTRRREYYFPLEWWTGRQRDKIHQQIEEIRSD
ncbi:MAG: hypothetical protein P4M08_03555 [Oligoflexia bacterium]|nr:hypothetical protein [Oligoflexia bacterium]